MAVDSSRAGQSSLHCGGALDQNVVMAINTRTFALGVGLMLAAGAAYAGKCADTVKLFKNAGESAGYVSTSYAYAVFPTIGTAGFIIGGAHGTGCVYVRGKHVGKAAMTQLTAGFQAGAKAYSQIVFFEDKRALDEFESGSFEFDAGVSATAITAAASASAGTTGATSGASGGKNDAATASAGYQKGMAVFVITKGGLMYTATVGGQRFSYSPL
jgi:lipid-binding SYLF domain-containing protein